MIVLDPFNFFGKIHLTWFESYWRGLFVNTRLAPMPIMLVNIVFKFIQILLNLELFANFNSQFHTLLDLMLSFLLFHEFVDLERIPLLLPFDFLVI